MLNERHDVVDEPVADCDCAPTARERRVLWPSSVTRRSALALGAIGVVALGATAAPRLPAAYAADYPSWDDVVRAKANQAAKAQEVTRIQNLITSLQANVTRTQQEAKQAGDDFYQAQQDFFTAAHRADDLQSQADAKSSEAKQAAERAGKVAAQLYRNGDNAALQLFLSGSAANADDLLQRLGTMDTVLQANDTVYAEAMTARNSAQSLSDQAKLARDERDRLQKVAEQKMVAAQQAAEAAQAALTAQNQHLGDLQAQLAALKDTTAKTVAQYQAGVIAARKAREAAEARARAAAEAAARAAASHNTGGNDGGGGSGGGGGGGSGGGRVVGSGWCRPSNGWQSSGYGWRPVTCSPAGYCSSSFHEGVDLADSCGSAIYAACSGRVVYAGYNGGYGNYIKIDHGDGTGSGYGHIRPGGIFVGYGQYVQAGQLIASEGNTGNSFGCHLHFETYVNGATVNPVPFMAARGISV